MTAEDWDARYAAAPVWSQGPNAVVADLLGPLEPGRAVDLGAGEGRHALWLAELGWRVTAVDFSATGLERGRSLAAERGLEVDWQVADVTAWEPGEQVDLVLVAYLQLPEPVLTSVLRRAGGWLVPGGHLLVIGHDRANLERGHGGPQDPDVLHDAQMLAAAAEGLEVLDLEQVARQVSTDEGPRTAVDTLLMARRPPGS
ncbi:MAG TPA: class I SAM-dependent methyltransferase [Jiangellales bacterium]|nr:class I SAM-dependent methyltransferase [Jiangellales bacterium]